MLDAWFFYFVMLKFEWQYISKGKILYFFITLLKLFKMLLNFYIFYITKSKGKLIQNNPYIYFIVHIVTGKKRKWPFDWKLCLSPKLRADMLSTWPVGHVWLTDNLSVARQSFRFFLWSIHFMFWCTKYTFTKVLEVNVAAVLPSRRILNSKYVYENNIYIWFICTKNPKSDKIAVWLEMTNNV